MRGRRTCRSPVSSSVSNVSGSIRTRPELGLVGRQRAHLHAVHGLSDLVQVVGGAEGLQADVRQLQLLFPEFVLQLEHDLRLGLGALAQPGVKQGGRIGGEWECQFHRYSSNNTERNMESVKKTAQGKVRHEGWEEPGAF